MWIAVLGQRGTAEAAFNAVNGMTAVFSYCRLVAMEK
jgi:hypothetical protein